MTGPSPACRPSLWLHTNDPDGLPSQYEISPSHDLEGQHRTPAVATAGSVGREACTRRCTHPLPCPCLGSCWCTCSPASRTAWRTCTAATCCTGTSRGEKLESCEPTGRRKERKRIGNSLPGRGTLPSAVKQSCGLAPRSAHPAASLTDTSASRTLSVSSEVGEKAGDTPAGDTSVSGPPGMICLHTSQSQHDLSANIV